MSYFPAHGVPAQIPLIIGMMESGLNNGSYDATGGYPSYGIFQANTNGGMGAGHNPQNLVDPNYQLNNTEIGMAIVNAFNDAGGMARWNAIKNNEQLQRDFIRHVHLMALVPDEASMNRNYDNNWSAHLATLENMPFGSTGQGGGIPQGTAQGLSSLYDPAHITSGFMEPFYLDSGGVNKGLDFGAAGGTPVPSTVSGTVIIAHDDGQGWGPRVLIQDNQGVYHSFGHLENLQVSEGDQVGRGQVVGAVGHGIVGTSTGPHLSYDVYRMGPNGQEWINPMSFLDDDLGIYTNSNVEQAYNYTREMFEGILGDMGADAAAALENYDDSAALGVMDPETDQPVDGTLTPTAENLAAAANMAAQQALAQQYVLSNYKPGDEQWPMTVEVSADGFGGTTEVPRPYTVAELQAAIAENQQNATRWNALAEVVTDNPGAVTMTITDGVGSIDIDPAAYDSLPPATKRFVDQAIANNGVELWNGYVTSYNQTVNDEFHLAEAYANFQNDLETQLFDFATENNININNVKQLNYEMRRQHGMDINDFIQRNWENAYQSWEGGVSTEQMNWENQLQAEEIFNDLTLTLHELARAYTADEAGKIESEYAAKVQYYDNLLKYDQATQTLVDRQLERWFGIRDQNQNRAEYVMSQAPWMTEIGKTAFTGSDLGSIGTEIAKMAGLDPNSELLKYTGQIDPQALLAGYDKAQGVGGMAPDYSQPVTQLGNIPQPYTLPDSIKPPGEDAFKWPGTPPHHEGPPIASQQGVGWAPMEDLTWNVDAPTRDMMASLMQPGGLLYGMEPSITNPLQNILNQNGMLPGAGAYPIMHAGGVYGHDHAGGAEHFLSDGRPVPPGMSQGTFDPFNRASLPNNWGQHMLNMYGKRHPAMDPTGQRVFGGRSPW